MTPAYRKYLLLPLFGLLPNAGFGASMEDLSQAIKAGDVKLSFRYRYEFVDQDGPVKDAGASTLLSRLSWTSGAVGKLSAGLEADYLSVIGSERYNSTENGNTRYPVVADPEGFDLNQAFLKYTNESVTVTGGRQRVIHADQRFIGGVAWRQNEQTYDALRIQGKPSKNISLDYTYVANVNRIFGPDDGAQPADWESNSHFFTANWSASEKHKFSGFAYLLDFENDNGLPNSTRTVGVTYNGKFGNLGIDATLAQQSDYADSPLDYDANFASINASLKLGTVTVKAGYDLLGSDDGVAAFRTPLATLHKFQGWADKFLATPANGIEDTSIGLSTKIGKVALAATWHNFAADEGSADYGTELNAVATLPINPKFAVQLKYADYNADDFATDTTKVWLMLTLKL